MMRTILTLFLSFFLLFCFSLPAFAFDYSQLNTVLKQYAQDENIETSELDQFLSSYQLKTWGEIEELSREEQLAFWINAFNALTIRKSENLQLKDRVVSLKEIKDTILRFRFRDERIHFALLDIAKNGPELREEAYEGSKIDVQLDDQIRKFLSDKSRNIIEPKSKKIILSYVFKEYGDDFLLNYGSYYSTHKKFTIPEMAVLSFIAQHSPPEIVTYLEEGKYKIQYLPREIQAVGHLN